MIKSVIQVMLECNSTAQRGFCKQRIQYLLHVYIYAQLFLIENKPGFHPF